MPVITLPDGSTRSFEKPVSIMEIAQDIGPGLAKATVAGTVNGTEYDAAYVIDTDSDVSIITDKSEASVLC